MTAAPSGPVPAGLDPDPWFEMANDLLCEVNPQGHFTRLNGAWERSLGFPRDQLMARPFVDFLHPDDVEPTVEVLRRLEAARGETDDFENRFRTSSGQWRTLRWTGRWHQGLIYGVARDISDHQDFERERRALVERMEAIARTDPLTGLPNRRAWDEEVPREFARGRRLSYDVTVGMLDIDRFKAYNDTRGHAAGDALLRGTGTAWRLQLRVTDMLARLGGEEFGLLLANCPPLDGATVVERLRQVTPEEQTFSAGLARWDGSESADELLERADRAMYEAKRQGRDRCVVAD